MKYLDPKNDLIFKKIFGEHKNILMSLLNSLLPLAENQKIVSLEYLTPELAPETFLEKFTVVDVRCKDNNDRIFVVEMQMNWSEAFKQRVVFNSAKAYVSQAKIGFAYQNLQPVYALNLVNKIFDSSQNYYHHYIIYDKENNNKLDGLEFVFIELPKFQDLAIKENNLSVQWLRFLTEVGETTQNIDSSILANDEINEASLYLEKTSLTKEEQVIYEKNWDRIRNEAALIEDARKEGLQEGMEKGKILGIEEGIEKGKILGIEEGIEKGRKEVQLAIAKNMKKNGIAIDLIKLSTDLSQSEIESL